MGRINRRVINAAILHGRMVNAANRWEGGILDNDILIMVPRLGAEIEDAFDIAGGYPINDKSGENDDDNGRRTPNNHITPLSFLFQLLPAFLTGWSACSSTHCYLSSSNIPSGYLFPVR
jgi:hypothetical protein